LDEASGPGAQIENGWLLFEGGRDFTFSLDKSKNGVMEAVPRHIEIKEPLAKKILKNLNAE